MFQRYLAARAIGEIYDVLTMDDPVVFPISDVGAIPPLMDRVQRVGGRSRPTCGGHSAYTRVRLYLCGKPGTGAALSLVR